MTGCFANRRSLAGYRRAGNFSRQSVGDNNARGSARTGVTVTQGIRNRFARRRVNRQNSLADGQIDLGGSAAVGGHRGGDCLLGSGIIIQVGVGDGNRIAGTGSDDTVGWIRRGIAVGADLTQIHSLVVSRNSQLCLGDITSTVVHRQHNRCIRQIGVYQLDVEDISRSELSQVRRAGLINKPQRARGTSTGGARRLEDAGFQRQRRDRGRGCPCAGTGGVLSRFGVIEIIGENLQGELGIQSYRGHEPTLIVCVGETQLTGRSLGAPDDYLDSTNRCIIAVLHRPDNLCRFNTLEGAGIQRAR